MGNLIENKNIYIAEKLLEFLQTKPRSIAYTNPETFLISANSVSELFPKLTIENVAKGFLSLNGAGAINYKNWKSEYQEDYGQINFLDVDIFPEKLKQFIKNAKNDIFGFQLSDEKYRKNLLEILMMLTTPDTNALRIEKFQQENTYDILEKISDFSDAIEIQNTLDVDFERGDYGDIICSGAGYIPDVVIVKNKTKLKTLLNKIKKTIEDIYKKGVDSFLLKNNALEWRCSKCGRWLGSYNSPKEIMELMDKFSNNGYRACHKCRSKNIFHLFPDGSIKFSAIKND